MWDLIVSFPDHCLSFYFVGAHVHFHTHQPFLKSLEKNQLTTSCLFSRKVFFNLPTRRCSNNLH